jgi:transcriptional regulator with XRE-family HTH domain
LAAPKNTVFSKDELGRRVRAIREGRGVTQVELAKILKLPQSNVSEMERGARGLTVHQVVRLAKALKVSADEILLPNGKGSKITKPAASLKVLRRVQRIEKLPEPRQRVVLRLLDALIDQEIPSGRTSSR